MENENEFEQRVVNYLSNSSRIIIQKNTASRRGFTGRRKPDLVTIEQNLELEVWELKSPRECSQIHREKNMWLRHPTPSRDYLTSTRQQHANNQNLDVNVRGWCVVIDGELRYWFNNHGTGWKLPFEYTGQFSNAVIAAPISQEEAIRSALNHLNLSWQTFTGGEVFFAKGVY